MNPGIVEEGGETARTIVESLKNNPMLLFTLVMVFALNGLFVALTYSAMQNAEQRRHELEMLEDKIDSEAKADLRKIIVDRCFVNLAEIDDPARNNRLSFGGPR